MENIYINDYIAHIGVGLIIFGIFGVIKNSNNIIDIQNPILGKITKLENRSNYLLVLISLELMLVGIAILFILNSSYNEGDDIMGILTSIYILTIGAAESSLGLSILVIYFRNRGDRKKDYIIKTIN